jgi:hypothetical protein
MTLWWIGNVIFIVVVIPVVVLLLHMLLRPVVQIKKRVDSVYANAGRVVVDLDSVTKFVQTRTTVRGIRDALLRYLGAVQKML